MSEPLSNPPMVLEVTPSQAKALVRNIRLAQPVPWPRHWDEYSGPAAKVAAGQAFERMQRAPGAKRAKDDLVALRLEVAAWLDVLGELVRSAACGHLQPSDEDATLESIGFIWRMLLEQSDLAPPPWWAEGMEGMAATLQSETFRLRSKLARMAKILEIMRSPRDD